MPRPAWDKKPRFNKNTAKVQNPATAAATVKAAEKGVAKPASKKKVAPVMSKTATKAVKNLEKEAAPKKKSSAPPALLASFEKDER
ncbi:hypothetical protein [Bosea sp. TAF32]|uniref:hypothetical protein n=1 Tax=Bosea sp. TAF32 TaxID=3237482 RepID=UPI003F921DA1